MIDVTGALRGAGLLAVAAAVVWLSQPFSSAPAAGDSSPAPLTAEAEAALADGVVTPEEMERTLREWARCVEDRGFEVIALHYSPNEGWTSEVSVEGGDPTSAMDECEAIHVTAVAAVHNEGAAARSAWESRQQRLASCMEASGVGTDLPADATVLSRLDQSTFIRCDTLDRQAASTDVLADPAE